MIQKNKPEAKWYHGLISFSLLIGIMLYLVVGLGVTPLIPLLIGCVIASVVGESVFPIVMARMAPMIAAFLLGLAAFLMLGWTNAAADSGQITAAVEPLKATLKEAYRISPLCVLPLAVVIAGIVLKLPAIPAILLGVIVGGALAVFGQGASVQTLLSAVTDGAVSDTGLELIDTLFTAGGISSMMSTITIVLAAMSFGGLMQGSGQIRALIAPLAKWLRRFGLLSCVTALFCPVVNILLPDQALGISVPGQMFQEEFDRRGYGRVRLSAALAAAPLTSPLVPWNTCGLYCAALLGVSAGDYLPYAFFNLIGLAVAVLLGFFSRTPENAEGAASITDIQTTDQNKQEVNSNVNSKGS